MIQKMCVLAVFALLVSCSNDNGDTKAGTVYDDQIQAIEKAKALKKQLENSMQKQRQAID